MPGNNQKSIGVRIRLVDLGWAVVFAVLMGLAGGCQTPGKASAGPAKLQLPPNPDTPSEQKWTTREIWISPAISPGGLKYTNLMIIREQSIDQKISSSFFDRATSKLAAMRPVQYAGVFLLLLAIFSVTPYGSVVFGSSVTTRAIIFFSGFALVFLPMLIAGNETLILMGGLALPAIWWIAHRHGEHKARSENLGKSP